MSGRAVEPASGTTGAMPTLLPRARRTSRVLAVGVLACSALQHRCATPDRGEKAVVLGALQLSRRGR